MASEASDTPPTSSPPSPLRRRLAWTVLAVLVLLGLDAVWAVLSAKGHLTSARDNLRAAADLLVDGKVEEAEAHLATARSAAAAARNFGAHPSVWIAGSLPFLSDDVKAVKALADSAELTASAGSIVVHAVKDAGWAGSGLPGLSGSDPLSQEQLAGVAPQLDAAAKALTRAEQLLEEVPTGGLLGPVRTAVVTARGKLASNAKLLVQATDIAELLPRLFQDGKRYLLVVQNLDEPRGTGGFMGYYGFVRIENGRMHLEQLVPADDVLADHPVDAPKEFRDRWADLDALADLRQANYEPDLPTTGGVILQLAEAHGWGRFDGILMVDQIWISYMLEAMGPVQTPAWPEPITADNSVRVLSNDVFFVEDRNGNYNEDESNAVQGAIAQAVWNALESRDVPPADLAEAISRSVSERHLQLYATDPEVQRSIQDLGAAGDTRLGKNPLYVTWSELSANKLAILQDRSVYVDVNLDENGTATVTTTLSDVNHAKPGDNTEFFGDGEDFPISTFAAYVSVYLPEEIDGYPSFEASGPTVTGVQQDQGRPVAIGLVEAPPRGEYTWSVTYTAPGAVTRLADANEYRLDFLPQPAIAPLELTATIHFPEGATVISTSPGLSVDGSTVTFEGAPVTEQSLWVRFR